MFEKIVVAIDGSPFSDAAIAAAGGLAAKLRADVEVLHVHEHDLVPSKAGMSPDLETPEEANVVVATAIERLKSNGVSANGHVLQSSTRDVPRKIIEFTNESGADLIIVGRRGLSSLTGMLVGSVSNKLIHAATVPVMVAH
ncbi:MAG: universal stress protein [Candidatus Dormiibacterota bacterium]